jgi:hypothetical protein
LDFIVICSLFKWICPVLKNVFISELQ